MTLLGVCSGLTANRGFMEFLLFAFISFDHFFPLFFVSLLVFPVSDDLDM